MNFDQLNIQWMGVKFQEEADYQIECTKAPHENLADFLTKISNQQLRLKLKYFINNQDLDEIYNVQHFKGEHILGHEGHLINTIELSLRNWSTERDFRVAKIHLNKLTGNNLALDNIKQSLLANNQQDKFLRNYLLEEMEMDDIQLYACSQCGDRACGYLSLKLEVSKDTVKWMIGDGSPQFTFQSAPYMEQFNAIVGLIQSKTNNPI